jgi:hypothetical protein
MLLFLFGTTLPLGCSSEFSNCDDTRCQDGGSAGSSGKGGGSSGSGGKGGASGGTDSGSGGTAGTQGGEPNGGSAGTSTLPCNGACSGAKPVCKQSTDTCVECLKDGNCDDATPFCDTTKNVCVACLDNEDCESPTASKCDGGQCVGCGEKADCSHIDGKVACDTSASECVECTVGDESPCGTKSCSPVSQECTSTERGSIANCKPCLADSECAGGDQPDPDYRCVPMEFKGSPRPGGFCLRRVSKTCARPYMIAINAESLSGAPSENYCGIDEANVRCEAVLDLEASRTCTGTQSDEQCGCPRDEEFNCTEPGQGGLCRDFVTADDRCTYQCGVDDDCPTGKSCLGVPTKFCQ